MGALTETEFPDRNLFNIEARVEKMLQDVLTA